MGKRVRDRQGQSVWIALLCAAVVISANPGAAQEAPEAAPPVSEEAAPEEAPVSEEAAPSDEPAPDAPAAPEERPASEPERNAAEPAPTAAEPDVVILNQAPSGNAPTVLVMFDDPRLLEALAEELRAGGYHAEAASPPSGETRLARAAAAQETTRARGARSALFVERSTPEDGAMIRAVTATGESIRHAPLPAPMDQVRPRVFAVVASSLLDELSAPPQVRVRVNVTIESDVPVEVEVNTERSGSPTEEAVPEPTEAPAPEPTPEPEVVPEPEGDIAPPTIAPPTIAPMAPPAELQDGQGSNVFFGLDLVPFVGTSSFHRANDIRRFSLGVVGTLSGGVRGVEASTALNITNGDVHGAQFTAGGNIVTGNVIGAQVSAGFNYAREVRGVQLSAGLNIARGDVHGLQVTSGVNLALRDVGAQVAAGINFARDVRYAQVAAGINFARDVRLAQVGSVNLARKAGAQIGLVNIAKNAGFQLGLLNINREGRSHLELSVTESGIVGAYFKHGGAHYHYLYGVQSRPFGDGAHYGFSLGIGAHITPSERFFVDIDLIGTVLQGEEEAQMDPDGMLQLRLVGGLQLSQRFALIAGVTANVSFGRDRGFSPYGHADFGDLEPVDDPFDPFLSNNEIHVWPGLMVGAQFF